MTIPFYIEYSVLSVPYPVFISSTHSGLPRESRSTYFLRPS